MVGWVLVKRSCADPFAHAEGLADVRPGAAACALPLDCGVQCFVDGVAEFVEGGELVLVCFGYSATGGFDHSPCGGDEVQGFDGHNAPQKPSPEASGDP